MTGGDRNGVQPLQSNRDDPAWRAAARCLLAGAPLIGFPPATWAVFAALAAGPHLAGHGLLNLAVRYLPAPVVNISLAGEPILSTSYAAALFDEWPGLWFYGGAALILGGLLVQFAGRRSREREPS